MRGSSTTAHPARKATSPNEGFMILYHLYTIAALIALLMLLYRLFRGPSCNHKWEVVVERELPAPAEILGKEELALWRLPEQVYAAGRKKYYAILRCKECPALREFCTLSGGEFEKY